MEVETEELEPLHAVVDRLVAQREQWLVEEGISLDRWIVLGGVQGVLNTLKYLDDRNISSDTAERLKQVWQESDQEAANAIDRLLHPGVDVKSTEGGAASALQYAVGNGHINTVSLLLARGIDVDAHNEDGWTALHNAVHNGHTDIILALLEGGADVGARSNNGNTALHLAAFNGNADVVKLLLAPSTIVKDVNSDGSTDGADVRKGVDVDAKNTRGNTALHEAAANGHMDVVLYLLDRNADIEAVNSNGLTVLHRAITRGSTAVVSLLLERSVDVYAITKDGHDPLSHMIIAMDDDADDEYLAVAQLLCSQEPKLNLPSSNQLSHLPTHQLGMIACVKYWQDCHEKNLPLLKIPPEVVKGGEDVVKGYVAKLEKPGADEVVYRRNICVVGPSTWGKSSLIKSITKATPVQLNSADRTIGIDLFSLVFTAEENGKTKKHHVTFWDFADQDVSHVAHTVFFSKRTLYLVCVDLQVYARMLEQAKEQSKMKREVFRQRFFEENVLRWMGLILLRQPDAQIKLIGTKHDMVSESSQTGVVNDVKFRLINFLEDDDGNMEIVGHVAKELEQEFIKDMATASLKSVESIKQVKSCIQNAISAKPQLSFLMPATYTQVLNYIIMLRTRAAKEPQEKRLGNLIVSVDELTSNLMRLPGLKGTNCREILRVLHQLGDVLWYEDCGEEFENWKILEPSLMLDLVSEIVNHKYGSETGEDYKDLWNNGILPHSLLLTFKLWKCLADIDMTMVHNFKHLLHHLNLVYPVDDLELIDEADIIVPMYWKMREGIDVVGKAPTKQKTILEQNVHDDWHVAKWRYSVPIAISEVLFVNFVVNTYHPYGRCVARDTQFECSVRGEFRVAIQLSSNKTERLDDITIEIAAPTKKFAWAKMRYYVIGMEIYLERNYPALSKHSKLKRFVVDDEGVDHDVKILTGKVEDEARLRQKAPWLPPDFSWFIHRAWRNPEVLDILHLHHRLEVFKNHVGRESHNLPSLWTLSYPRMGELLELRIHSDLSSNCCHKPLKIEVTDNFFATHSDFFQLGISLVSLFPAVVPMSAAHAALTQVLHASIPALYQATTVQSIIDRADQGSINVKSSKGLCIGPGIRSAFLLRLLSLHNPPLDERNIRELCNLHRTATEDGYYIWMSPNELDQLKNHVTVCEPNDILISPKSVPPSPVLSTVLDEMCALLYSARCGSIEEVAQLLNEGTNITMRDKNDTTALHCAAYNGHSSMVALLLDRGAVVFDQDKNGKTALHYSAFNGYTDVVIQLLDQKVDVSAEDKLGNTALHVAAQNAHIDAVSLLLRRGAKLAARGQNGMTALLCGAQGGHTEMVLYLLDRGADVHAFDNDRMSVLHHSITSGDIAIVTLLLRRGVDVDAEAKSGHNPLSLLILTDYNLDDEYVAAVHALCSKGARLKRILLQNRRLEKHQLGMIACIQYWQDHHDRQLPLLNVPSEVIKNGADAVNTYLTELEKTVPHEVVHRLKVCVVGPSNWGKSSLIKSMTTDKPVLVDDADRTIGIDLFSMRFEDENDGKKKKHHVALWDFAGQDVYHVAHAVFFSKRALYLVCVDLHEYGAMLLQANSMEIPDDFKQQFFENHILRWIVLVLFRQPNAQFKILGTKCDKVLMDTLRMEVAIDVQLRLTRFLEDSNGNFNIKLMEQFDQRIEMTSVMRESSVSEVKESIERHIIVKPDLSFEMPATYSQVLNYITEKRLSVAYADQNVRMGELIVRVNELCMDLMLHIVDLTSVRVCKNILQTLHELGDVLWYGDEKNIEEFKDWIILDPTVMLDLVREVVNHEYNDKDKEDYRELRQYGILRHSLLMTFQSWKCLSAMNNKGDLMLMFKRLLQHLNLVYPVNDLEYINEIDVIVPTYWKTREDTNAVHKPLTKQNTILEQNVHKDWHIAIWRYTLPISISNVIFVNFVVKCYRPYFHCDARDTRFSISVRKEFRAAFQLSTTNSGRLGEITVEVAAPTKKLAWAEMKYYVVAMEEMLEKDYPGLIEHGNIKRSIVDQNTRHPVNKLMGNVEGEVRLRDTRVPWLPPDFKWFIQRVWTSREGLDKFHLDHRMEKLTNRVVTSQSSSLPSLWTLLYPGKGSPVELRIHSDFSGGCFHEPLKIKVTDNLFTRYQQFVQVGITALSIASAAIPIGVVGAAAQEVLKASRSRLDNAITVKSILDKANLGPGEEISSQELGSPGERAAFLKELLALNEPRLFDEFSIGKICGLHRVASKEGCYIWVTGKELEQLDKYDPDDPKPVVQSILLRIIDATGNWSGKCFAKMYCEWQLLDGSTTIATSTTKESACAFSGVVTWESEVINVTENVGTIDKLRACTLRVSVKQARRVTGWVRSDMEIAHGQKDLNDQVSADFSTDKPMDVPINVVMHSSPQRTVNCKISIKFVSNAFLNYMKIAD